MSAVYVHESLSDDHIRLITLLPGHGAVQISLSQERFSDIHWPRYEALSYSWGDPTKIVSSVEVISEWTIVPAKLPKPKPKKGRHRQQQHVQLRPTDATVFPVTENLYYALLHLRGIEPRILWIDAICINQSNLEEKSTQIWKMGSIYKNAERVVVWLGSASENSTKALDVLSHLGKQVELNLTRGDVQKNPACEIDCEDWHKNESVLPYDASTWQAIIGLLSRPWFSRVWIRQEIGLADQTRTLVQCGNTSIRWEYFRNAMASFQWGPQKRPKVDLQQFNRAHDLIWSIVSQDANTTLVNLLDTTRQSSCFDPRDRLFAMLDLAADSSDFEIQPNYSKPVSEIYKEFLITHCQASNSVDLLQFCDARDSSIHQPSWVPLWDKSLPYRDCLRGWPSSAIGAFEFLEDGTLGVDGIFCGIISDYTSMAPFLALEDVAPLIRLWIKDELKLDLNLVVGGYDTLCNIFSCNLLRDRYFGETGFASLAEATAIIEHMLQGRNESDLFEVLSLPGAADMLSSMSIFLTGRRMFSTKAGHVGLGPSFIQPGDTIWAILGCSKLVVLREDILRCTYRIVGHCNLQGFMDLEALLGALPFGFRMAEDSAGAWAYEMWFVDPNGDRSRIDPRIGEGYPGWDSEDRDEDDRIVWENIKTEERTYHDPRHSDVEFLRKRGTKVERILLG